MGSPVDYQVFLAQDPAELQVFASLLTINETYFMRESVQFDLLADKVLGEMLATQPPGSPIRILAAGCSTGEEPYSIMISLLERHGAGIGRLVSITGVDVDREALSQAERAVYGGLSFRALPDALRRKYFEPLGGGRHRVRDFVRQGVRFLPLNLAADEYPAALQGLDVIFYRNVSIYFDPPTQTHIFRALAGLLKVGGWLFVSSTETLTHDFGALTLVEVDGLFCYRKIEGISFENRRKARPALPTERVPAPAAAGRTPDVAPEIARAPAATVADPPTRVARPAFDDALALASQKRYDEALACIDQFLLTDPSFVNAHMLRAGILVDLRRPAEARRSCLSGLERDPWCLDGHLLLGLVSRMDDDDEEAVKNFRQAVYIQPSCWLAHFHLAQIHAARRDLTNARREYEVVVRLLEKSKLEGTGLTFFPLAFPAEQVLHVCRHNLAKLGRPGE